MSIVGLEEKNTVLNQNKQSLPAIHESGLDPAFNASIILRKIAFLLFCVTSARPIKMRNMAKMLFCVRCEDGSGASLEARINNFLKITTRLPQLLISLRNVFGSKAS